MDAHESITRLIAQTQSTAAALQYLGNPKAKNFRIIFRWRSFGSNWLRAKGPKLPCKPY